MTAKQVVQAVRSDSFAGVERYIVETSNELAARGWRVTVVGGDPEQFVECLADGVLHFPATTTGQVRRVLINLQSPLVHSHMTAADLASALVGGTGTTRVSTRHFAAPRGSNFASRVVAKGIMKRFSLELAISEFVTSIGGSGAERVLLNGVPAPSTTTDWQDRSNTVLVVQRWEPEKDTACALRMWAASEARSRGWRLRLAGRGSEEPVLRALAQQLGICDSVDFLGFRTDVADLMAGAKVLLAPAPAEPFGLAVVEAMSLGMAVLAARGGAHPETLGPAGAYFDPGDSEGGARELNALTTDAVAAAQGDRARARYLSTFTLGRHVDVLEELYAEALGG